MLRLIALRGVRAHKNVAHFAGETFYTYGSKPCSRALLQLENKQQIMQNNVETQHNRMYSLYIGSLPNGTLYQCIVTSQVFVEI